MEVPWLPQTILLVLVLGGGEYITIVKVITNPAGSEKHHVGNRDIKSAHLGAGEMNHGLK